jgi:hypothetical protein
VRYKNRDKERRKDIKGTEIETEDYNEGGGMK